MPRRVAERKLVRGRLEFVLLIPFDQFGRFVHGVYEVKFESSVIHDDGVEDLVCVQLDVEVG